MERDGYFGSNLSGDFENDKLGSGATVDTGRSIEIADHFANSQPIQGEYEMSELNRNPALKEQKENAEDAENNLGYSIE